MCCAADPASFLLELLWREACLLSEIFLNFFFFLGHSIAFHNHFMALWHARTNFMACSVAAEYLLFPGIPAKQTSQPDAVHNI